MKPIKEVKKLEVEIKQLRARIDDSFRHLLDSRLIYCSVCECPNCEHQTMQQSIRLQGESEDAHTCLNCGKIWHKEQKIVEYKGYGSRYE